MHEMCDYMYNGGYYDWMTRGYMLRCLLVGLPGWVCECLVLLDADLIRRTNGRG